MGVKGYAKPLDDVFESELDERLAPALYEVFLGREHRVYSDPVEFMRRTHLSLSMREILRSIVRVLSGRGGRNVYPLFSLFGGGKTHTLITVLHAVRSPEAFAFVDKELAAELADLGSVAVVVLDCDCEELVPSPLRPLEVGVYSVRTIWGALAHQLGRYDDLRVEDEKLVVPATDRLKRLLGDRPVVILVDEVVKYASRFKRSSDEELRGYGDSVVTFVENLAKAVADTRAVLVLTLPLEVREEHGQRVARAEEAYRDLALAFYKAIGRVTATYDIPLRLDDIVEVLKKRIFEHIDLNTAASLRSDYLGTYSAEQEFFGKIALSEGSKIDGYAPYHPSYVVTLYEVVTKNPNLQKTRDALKITRKVVRNLWGSSEDPDLIMPWHIDVRFDDIRGLILTKQFSQFEPVVSRDLMDRVLKASKPSLAYAIALSIFLRTYVYGLAVRAEKVFPTREDIAFCVYERSLFARDDLRVADVQDVLDELVGSLLYLQEKEGRYWFTPIASVIELVEGEASRISDVEAYGKFKETVEKLLLQSPERLRTGRGRVELPTVFDPQLTQSQVFEEVVPPSVDVDKYVLAVYLRSLREPDDVLNVLYMAGPDKPRVHKNTVAALYPSSDDDVKRLLLLCKRLLACDKIVKELGSYYADKDIQEVQRKKLNDYEKQTYGRLLYETLSAFNRVAYPVYDSVENRDWYKVESTKAAALSLVKLVEETLAEREIGKISRDMDFDTLNYLLKTRLGIDLSEGDREFLVSEIISFFYTNPRLPFTVPDVIKEALKDGLSWLKIGVLRGSNLYWKRVYGSGEVLPVSEQGVSLDALRDDDLIIPWRLAARRFVEAHKESQVVADLTGKRRVWYVLKEDGHETPLSELAEQSGFEVRLKANPVVKKEQLIEEDVDLILTPDSLTVRPGVVVEVALAVEPVGEVSGRVTLSAESGSVEPSSGDLPLRAKWVLKAPVEAGLHFFEISASVGGKVVKRQLKLVVELEPEVSIVSSEEIEGHVGSELLGFTVNNYDAFEGLLNVLAGKLYVDGGSVRIKVKAGEGEVCFTVRSIEPEVMRQLMVETLEYLGRVESEVSELTASLRAVAPIKLDRSLAIALKGLKDLKCRVKRAH